MFQQRMREARERREGGFTLIELLIVIIVLGILAGMVVFGVAKFRSDANTAACNADKKTVETAASAYFAGPGNATAPAPTVQNLVDGKYLKSLPTTITNVTIGTDGNVTAFTCNPA
jgi:prepilin-type N-terminal cleavage/methylation domain-containing protein